MTKEEFKKIQKQLNLLIKELEEGAIREGFDITSKEWEEFIKEVKKEVLKRLNLTLEKYEELSELYKENKDKKLSSFLDRLKSPDLNEIKEMTKSVAKDISEKIADEKISKNLKPPKIINKIVKQIIKEKPKIIRTEKIIREIDKKHINNLKKELERFRKELEETQNRVNNI